MRFLLNHSSMVPIYEQLTDQIRKAIISGELKGNEILPSVRVLAAELRISSLTVKKAYDHLEEAGLVVTVHGKGTYVADANPEFVKEAGRHAAEDELSAAVQHAVTAGFSADEIRAVMDMILEGI